MAKFNYNLLELDVDRLFEEHKIEDIIEIDKQYDVDIEKKRVDLRSMVGDRYKDILAASDAIKSMQTISETIVCNIDDISNGCMKLIESTSLPKKSTITVSEHKLEERSIAAQIRLAIVTNEHIWLALDEEDYALASQFYLLVQHVYTGLFLRANLSTFNFPIIKRLEDVSKSLKERILKKVRKKLETAELNAGVTGSNLTALLMLENYSSAELLSTFIEHRKAALRAVTKESHPSVRVQVSAMVKCLINTVHLLHDCFLSNDESGRYSIKKHLECILDETSSTTLSKINLPNTPLLLHIPDIVKQFRPKINTDFDSISEKDVKCVDDWLKVTAMIVEDGLNQSLKLVTTVKGLHIIREDAHKIELPQNWDEICIKLCLPKDFKIWQYYFQSLLTNRAKALITKRISGIIEDICADISSNLGDLAKLQQAENDLQMITWHEEPSDVSRLVDDHLGLSMKTKGFSPIIVDLCTKLDSKYLGLLEDVSFYFYGKEYEGSNEIQFAQLRICREKFMDRLLLEKHLQSECGLYAEKLIKFLKNVTNSDDVTKALMCARFSHALTIFCPNFRKCCSFSNENNEWDRICTAFSACTIDFWNVWVEDCLNKLDKVCDNLLGNVNVKVMLKLLPRWDSIEIQEQTEEKVFKSQIRIPSQPSLALQEILVTLTDLLNCILPHTLPKQVHADFVTKSMQKILAQYSLLLETDLNQTQALQFLFDVKFLTTLCVSRENNVLVTKSQKICDKLRSKIDPFDLDVFYSYLQGNVKKYAVQSQTILGCLLPSPGQLASLGVFEKSKETKCDPSIMALSTPATNVWFQLLPITVPVQKTMVTSAFKDMKEAKVTPVKQAKAVSKRSNDPAATVKSGAAALFGGLTTDWFS